MPNGVTKYLPPAAADHPLIALGCLLFLAIALFLGALDELEFIGDVCILGIRHGKARLLRLKVIGQRLWAELTTWDVEEPAKRVDGAINASNPGGKRI